MICRFDNSRRYPTVFLKMTGLRLNAFADLLLEASGKDAMRMPDPGRKHRKELPELLKEIPQPAVIIDSFEQRVQRCTDRKQADVHFSGKKKQHTLKP